MLSNAAYGSTSLAGISTGDSSQRTTDRDTKPPKVPGLLIGGATDASAATTNDDKSKEKSSSLLQRASSSGKQPVQEDANLASPRYKFDVESNKFKLVREKSPTRGSVKCVIKLTPAQLEKRRYNRKLNDAAAMKLLAPMLNAQKTTILTDVMQVIPTGRKNRHH